MFIEFVGITEETILFNAATCRAGKDTAVTQPLGLHDESKVSSYQHYFHAVRGKNHTTGYAIAFK